MPILSPDLVFAQAPLAGSPTDLVFNEDQSQSAVAAATPDLLFELPRLVGSPADLVFSRSPGGGNETGPAVLVNIYARLQNNLVATVVAGVPVRVQVIAALANTLTATARAVYDNRVTPWLDQRVAAPHNTATQAARVVQTPFFKAVASSFGRRMPWALAGRVANVVQIPFQPANALRLQPGAGWQIAVQRAAISGSSFQKAIAKPVAATGDWQLADTRSVLAQIILQAGVFKSQALTSYWQTAAGRGLELTGVSGASLYMVGRQFVSMPWRTATNARAGRSAGLVMPPVALQFSADLLFECPRLLGTPLDLVFGFHPCAGLPIGATFFILPARFYMTTHNLIAHRLPDMAEVPLYDCTLSSDVGSFAWQFSASGPESLFAQLAPVSGPDAALPQLLQVTLDGLVWVFMVESLKRSHSFGKRSISISGRSQTALVGAPWAREAAFANAAAANAQQLAAQALDLSGVALDWGITDWLVPSNAWSFAGSRLAAVQAIANAAGGYVQSHRSAAILQVRHPYPPRPSGDSGGPWNWGIGAADIELAPDAIITSGIERRDGADINAVYASGTNQGVLALVKRAGTAGDKLGDLQTDALITSGQAAEQRGLATLGKAGAQYAISLELPVLLGPGQPGVIDVGRLVQVNDTTPWRGRVRGVQVQAAMPKARQTITLERHL